MMATTARPFQSLLAHSGKTAYGTGINPNECTAHRCAVN
jgi:hypothetical protein